jgi:hypothetical protein
MNNQTQSSYQGTGDAQSANINPMQGSYSYGGAGIAGVSGQLGQGHSSEMLAKAAQQQYDQGAQPKTREIPEKIARLFDRTEMLSMKLAKFRTRLEPVLVLLPQGIDEKATAPFGTQLGQQLAEIATRVELMIAAVDGMDAQLEL